MWRCSETELNCVRIATRKIPELMQLLIGMSIRRYFPAIGTAGFERILVNGCRRDPRPPPIMTPRTSFIDGIAAPLLSIGGMFSTMKPFHNYRGDCFAKYARNDR